MVISGQARRNRRQPTSIPPSKRMTMRATTPMRDAVSIDTTDSPGNTSLATAATIRKIAGPGIGNHAPTLLVATATNRPPATMRTTAAKSTISDTAAGSLAPCMATYDAIADLPLEIEGYELEAFERPVSSGFVRHTTVVRLRGGGEEGRRRGRHVRGGRARAASAAAPLTT